MKVNIKKVKVKMEAEIKEKNINLIKKTSELMLQYNIIQNYIFVINKL